jgi:hypothetical protein
MNGFKMKKYMSFFVSGMMSLGFTLTAFVMVNDLIVATLAGFGGLVFGVLLGDAILRHPLLQVLEGEGNLIFDLSSPGVIQLYCAKVTLPWISVTTKAGLTLRRIFDRNISFSLRDNVIPVEGKDINGDTWIKIPGEEKVKMNFSLEGRPAFIMNSKLQTFVTKEFLGTLETKIMVEHLVLNLLKTIEELNQNIKDFGRYVMEQIRPQRGIDLNSPWIKVIGFIIVGIIIVYFGWPYAAKFLGLTGAAAASSVPTGAITNIADINSLAGIKP